VYGLLDVTLLRRLTRRTAKAPKAATDPTPTPSPIPTVAPVDREELRGCDAEADFEVEGMKPLVPEEELEEDLVLTEIHDAVKSQKPRRHPPCKHDCL
jgi:hypothetical protein